MGGAKKVVKKVTSPVTKAVKQVGNITGSVVTAGQKNNIFGGGNIATNALGLTSSYKAPSSGLSMVNGVSTYVPIGDQMIKVSDSDIKAMADRRGAELSAMRGREGLSNANQGKAFMPSNAPYQQLSSSAKGANNTSAKGAQ